MDWIRDICSGSRFRDGSIPSFLQLYRTMIRQTRKRLSRPRIIHRYHKSVRKSLKSHPDNRLDAIALQFEFRIRPVDLDVCRLFGGHSPSSSPGRSRWRCQIQNTIRKVWDELLLIFSNVADPDLRVVKVIVVRVVKLLLGFCRCHLSRLWRGRIRLFVIVCVKCPLFRFGGSRLLRLRHRDVRFVVVAHWDRLFSRGFRFRSRFRDFRRNSTRCEVFLVVRVELYFA